MTLFLSVTALETDDRGQDVIDQTFRVMGDRGHRRLPKSMGVRTSGTNQVMICTEAPEWLLVVYPAGFMDGFGCTQALSESLDCKAFNFEIYANETWWYNYFSSGILRDIFWQQPRYFEGVHPDEAIDGEVLAARRGNPDLLADEFFGMPIQMIRPYYVQIDDGEFRHLRAANPEEYTRRFRALQVNLDVRAHDDDRYPLSSVWVFTDFANKFNIMYPMDIQTQDNLQFFGLRPKDDE